MARLTRAERRVKYLKAAKELFERPHLGCCAPLQEVGFYYFHHTMKEEYPELWMFKPRRVTSPWAYWWRMPVDKWEPDKDQGQNQERILALLLCAEMCRRP